MNPPHRRTGRGVTRGDRIVGTVLAAAACVSVLVTAGVVVVLVTEGLAFFRDVSPAEFFTGTEWTPLFTTKRYGILPLVCGTLVTSVVALAVAVPAGLVTAVYLSEFAPRPLAAWIRPAFELISGVPSVVFGYFALLSVTPLLQRVYPALPAFNALSAGLVTGVMAVPLVASLSEDALRAVPEGQRDAARALGATPLAVATRVVAPAAAGGIMASVMLAASRVVGETMVVAIAAGQQPLVTADPRSPVETMTAYVLRVATGDVPHGSTAYRSVFAVAGALFLVTLALNIAGAAAGRSRGTSRRS